MTLGAIIQVLPVVKSQSKPEILVDVIAIFGFSMDGKIVFWLEEVMQLGH